MVFTPINLLVLLCGIAVFRLAASRDPSSCVRHCGSIANRISYPFGFSSDCEIPLECDEGTGGFRFRNFAVRNVTPDNLLVELPVKCDRPIHQISNLTGPNYAPTRRNGLLLQNCSSHGPGCVIPAALLEEQFRLQSCGGKGTNVSCFSNVSTGEYVNLRDVEALRCGFLYSSVVVDVSAIPAVSMEFQTMELEWWMRGKCNCSEQADCKELVSPNDGHPAYRCSCRNGFVGDGFNGGDGCRRVDQRCNPSKYMSGRCGGTTRVGVLVGGVVAGASSMAGLAVLCCYVRRRSAAERNRRSTRRLLSEAAGSCTVPLYHYKEIEKATHNFSEKQRLGTGAYGTVYAGKLHNDEWVAIKKIKHHDRGGIEQVMNEIKLLSSVSHPSLVRLLGCCIEVDEQILVYEFMPNGTLSQHLQRERGNGLPWSIRLTIAAETAKAIAYLHSAVNPPIFHRDIKSSNILLDHNYNSKVADFGLSRLGMPESSHVSTAPQGTPGYLDPQYHQNFHLSDKSDVYSFGVVLVEIISGLRVVDFSRDHSDVNLAALAIDRIGRGCVDEIIDPFLEPHGDAWTLSSIHKVAELAFRCLAFHQDMRPSMTEVADELELIRVTAWAQMDDHIFLGSSDSSSSSLTNRSEESKDLKKTGVASRRVVLPQRGDYNMIIISNSAEEKTESPVSVQESWSSEQSSPSTNSLLSNVVQ